VLDGRPLPGAAPDATALEWAAPDAPHRQPVALLSSSSS
jgi:hypothetical protein